ncbi:GNAT family N-acetyltransferase [Streptomyces sp. NPDC026673]|uniref:GNAT family N-acetyltransferase n=1 Tax=Streptomyces sp. NPDC026673 TaxID=3155724 RepID=UPI0033DF12A6
MSLEVRTIGESDFPGWLRAVNTGFHRPPTVTEEEVALRRSQTDLDRTQGAFDGSRCVATFRSMPRELTVPGGAVLPASAITNVTVTATHRRRGLASRMMAAELDASVGRGEPVAILVAAEYPIYGRYGFGPAAGFTEWEVDTARAGRPQGAPSDSGRIDLADQAEVLKLGPQLHDRVRLRTPGAINRTERFWEYSTGKVTIPSHPWKEPLSVFYRDASGRVDGLASYIVEDGWHGMFPKVPLTVQELIAATPEAERALWRYLLSVDWVATIRTGFRAQDDVLPLLLADPRAAHVHSTSDFMWLRLLDVPRALAARTYAAPGAVVLDVADPYGHAAGRFRLEAAADGTATAEAAPSAAPDVTLSAAALASLYLGDESAARLTVTGGATESRPGGAARLDALFRTARKPWAIDTF